MAELDSYSAFGYNTDVNSGYNPSAPQDVSLQAYADSLGKPNNWWWRNFEMSPGDFNAWRDNINNRYQSYLSAYDKAYDLQYNTDAQVMARAQEAGLNPYYLNSAGGSQSRPAAMPDFNNSQIRMETPPAIADLLQLGQFAIQIASQIEGIQQQKLENQYLKETMPSRVSTAKENQYYKHMLNNIYWQRIYGSPTTTDIPAVGVIAPVVGNYQGFAKDSYFNQSDINNLNFGRARNININSSTVANQQRVNESMYRVKNLYPAMLQLYKDSHELNKFPIAEQAKLQEYIGDLIMARINGARYDSQYYQKAIGNIDSILKQQRQGEWIQPMRAITETVGDVISGATDIYGATKGYGGKYPPRRYNYGRLYY